MRLALVCIVFFSLMPNINFGASFDDEKDVKDMSTRERIFVGGYIGLQFGTITSVNISPTIGYRLSNKLSAGVGGTYQYYRNRGWLLVSDVSYSTHIYGGSVFARYLITRQFFAHGELEALNLDSRIGFSANPSENRFWERNYFLGGGYRQALGPRTFLNIMLLYNFNNNSVIYYQNPIFRFGLDVRM
jgi:hypothetical protein